MEVEGGKVSVAESGVRGEGMGLF